MNTKKIITSIQFFLIASTLVHVNFTYSIDEHDIFIYSKDPETNIQVQYATLYPPYNRPALITKRLKDHKNGILCIIPKTLSINLIKQPVITFYNPSENGSYQKIEIFETSDGDKFTIYPRKDDAIIVTKKNKYGKNPEVEIARFAIRTKQYELN
jgi:hypothetical protein